ncbi:MAG: DNA-binding protein WhiA [Heliobacteriaceae bacterium]|nr:DNA-binding protein WhiA [Heliobacteriaceae bacterium]MDD4587761.1 DNA-binding protein WhiA [Heliobacteriaceae bacterium]
MSFSGDAKEELARVMPRRRCCQLAELAALIRMDGLLQVGRGRLIAILVTTDSASVARKVFRLVKSVFRLQARIVVRRKRRLKKSNDYVIILPVRGERPDLLKDLGIKAENGNFFFVANEDLVKRQCCRRAYLRGAFLGGGSVNSPEGTYHFEIITDDESHAEKLCDLFQRFKLAPKVSRRRTWFIVYLKESDQIVKMLSIIGAHTALLDFENVRIVKEMRNQVNRLVNCETANLTKTVNAAVRQVEMIKLIARTRGLTKLPQPLRDVAELRLQYPEASLKELGEMLSPPVGKSGVNHRIRKLEHMAEEIR